MDLTSCLILLVCSMVFSMHYLEGFPPDEIYSASLSHGNHFNTLGITEISKNSWYLKGTRCKFSLYNLHTESFVYNQWSRVIARPLIIYQYSEIHTQSNFTTWTPIYQFLTHKLTFIYAFIPWCCLHPEIPFFFFSHYMFRHKWLDRVTVPHSRISLIWISISKKVYPTLY